MSFFINFISEINRMKLWARLKKTACFKHKEIRQAATTSKQPREELSRLLCEFTRQEEVTIFCCNK